MRAMASRGRRYRTYLVEGFEVLVGKGADDNDHLTFEIADPHDAWLHVASVPGSHVVVRNPDRVDPLPRAVLEAAARLAAWYSKARGARGKVEVHVCRVADVAKRRGQPPGEVELARWKALRVGPAPPPLEEP